MLAILLPVAVAALAGTAYVMAKKPPSGTMTPARQSILDTALSSPLDPDKLRALAKVFRDEGLSAQADLLEKRAVLRELPTDVKEGRKAAFRAGMASTNAPAVRGLADEFDKEGATGAAAALRTHAFELEHPGASADLQAEPLAPITPSDLAAQAAAAMAQANQAPSHVTPGDPLVQAATALAQAQAANPDPTQGPVQAAAAAAEVARIAAINAAIDAGDHPESSALAVGLGSLPTLSSPTAGTGN